MFNLLAISPFDFKSIFGNLKSEWYFYLTMLIVVALVVLLAFAFRKQERINVSKTQKIVLIASFSALCVVANVFTFGTDTIKFSFVASICFVSGYLLGPVCGFSVGFVGDLIGCLIAPSGPYNAILSLGASLWGFFPGVIFGYFKGNKYLKAIISFIVSYLVCSVLLNTTGVYLMYMQNSAKYTTLMSYFIVRIPITSITLLINAVISIAILPVLERIKKSLSIKAEHKTPEPIKN